MHANGDRLGAGMEDSGARRRHSKGRTVHDESKQAGERSMPKSHKRKKNPGVGIDFKKAKHKVGKKLPRAQNETDTDIKSGKIFLSEQSVAVDKSEVATTSRNNTLKELLSQCKHYSEKVRMKAINGLVELLREHPSEARGYAAEIIAATSAFASDADKACRNAYCVFLRVALFPALGERSIQPFLPFLMGHICSAMTHLSAAIRDSGIQTINVVLEFRPDLVGKGYFAEICQHYVESLSRSSRGRSLTAGSLRNLLSICDGCQTFLRATLPHVGPGAVGQELGGGTSGEENDVALLNRGKCQWGPVVSPAEMGGGKDHGNGSDQKDVVLSGRLLSLLLDCWEECGLVSSGDLRGTQGGRQGNEGETCGVAILQCCTLLVGKFKADVLSEGSVAKIFTRVFPSYPVQVKCAVSVAAADLIGTTIAELNAAKRPFDPQALGVLSSWSGECLGSNFSTGMKVSLAILSFSGPEMRAEMLDRAFDAWQAAVASPGSTPGTDEVTNMGLRMLLELLEPPLYGYKLMSLDETLAAWIGKIPSLLWKHRKAATSAGVQHMFKLGLSVLLNMSRFVDSSASNKQLRRVCTELDQLAIKIVPLFVLKIKGKVHPGPLTKMPEALQSLAVDVLYNLPRLDSSIVSAMELSLLQPGMLSPPTADRLLDLIFFKSQFGDPKQVWGLIFSVMEHGSSDTDELLERVSRLALHCSPPSLAIRALVLPLLSKSTGPSARGALFFLRHCLMVIDEDLGIEAPVVDQIVRTIALDETGADLCSVGRDVIVRLVRQCPSAMPTLVSLLSDIKAAKILANYMSDALCDLDVTPGVVAGLRSCRQDVPGDHPDLVAVIDAVLK
jgi:hypothetical protein